MIHRVILACGGVPAAAATSAARGIEAEFKQHRKHFKNVTCHFANGELVLGADNDFDADGLALMDEFSDLLSAFLPPFDGDIRFVSSELKS